MSVDWKVQNKLVSLRDGIWAFSNFNSRYGESYFLLLQMAEWAIALNDFDSARKYLERCEGFDVDWRDHKILVMLISWPPPDKWTANEKVFQVLRECLDLSFSEANSLLVFQSHLDQYAVASLIDFRCGLVVLLTPAEEESAALFKWARLLRQSQFIEMPIRISRHETDIKVRVFTRLQSRTTWKSPLRLAG